MTIRRLFHASRFLASGILLGLALAGPRAWATGGDYGPDEYLAEGGRRIEASPEFYWADELKRLAKDYPAQEKIVPLPEQTSENTGEENALAGLRQQLTREADLRDFQTALKEGRLKPANPDEATRQHAAARATLDAMDPKIETPLPVEFESEFADYHRGAYFFSRGREHWEQARAAWEKLLARPKDERRYRSVWAAFMLGKIAMKGGDYAAAIERFQQVRALAKEGFIDTLGMAADSHGWEGRCEWKAGRPEKAATRFLTQLALGDESAIVSLKALVPDREPIYGMLNYGPEEEEMEKWTAEQKEAAAKKTQEQLAVCARDPLLRRLVTMHILATGSMQLWGSAVESARGRSTRWLASITALKLQTVRDAEYLGWAAYNAGDYAGAQRWLGLAEKSDTPAAAWLRAKLQRREGKLAEAAQSMQQAWRALSDPAAYYGWDSPSHTAYEDVVWPYKNQAGGDLASLHLARADFVQALDIFRQAGLDADAAYIAERVLTADELKKYIDGLPKPPPRKSETGEVLPEWPDWRYVLGRRLVREDRYDEAAAYLPEGYRKVLAVYVKALRDGENQKLPAAARARAWFRAAYIARRDGMELMGTEEAPDGFSSGGSFEPTNLPLERAQPTFKRTLEWTEPPQEKAFPVLPKPTKEELQRLAKNKIHPDVRYHYRVIAGALAMRAAKLLPDQTEELADVINTAGWWVKEQDEKAADKYYVELARRCSRTKLGRAVLAQKWFIDEKGPWRAREEQEHRQMLKAAGLANDNE